MKEPLVAQKLIDQPRTVLVVDDEKGIRQMLGLILRKHRCEVEEASDGLKGLEFLRKQRVDLIISDVMMPNMDGNEFCRTVKTDPDLRDIYFVLLTAKNGLHDRIVGLDGGADDYLGKPFASDELMARVRAGFRYTNILNELKQKNEEIKHTAKMDALTQVYNRHYYNEVITLEVTRTKRYGNDLSLIVIDIDKFKEFNDEYSHLVGDEVLRLVATILKNNTRELDIVARYGGEEFAIILPETDGESAFRVAEKLRRMVEGDQTMMENHRRPITISAGVAAFRAHGCTTELDFFEKADRALIDLAKGLGRNRVAMLPYLDPAITQDQ